MSFNNRYPREKAYNAAESGSAAIKNTGPSTAVIWRLPEEDFRINSTLNVMPGEEALFVKGDNIGQVFGAGTYTLSAQNYSFINRLRNLSTGGMNAFNCVIYFARMTKSMEVSWRTSSPIKVRDRGVGLVTELNARGVYKIEIEKPKRFLAKLLENKVGNINRQEVLNEYFENEFQDLIDASIKSSIIKTQTELLGLEKQLDEFSYIVQIFFSELMKNYGLKVIRFSIIALDNDEETEAIKA